MKKQDRPPKLFISYSWTSPDYEDWVLQLGTGLRDSGVDVILDKWDLKEGQDAYAFMEKMVTDPKITKVLMVCDKRYAEKADDRAGGVGTETQIISKEVYEREDQNKFVAIVTERDSAGKPYLPTYYKSRIYIDFSDDDRYAQSFEQLLRWIYDKPLYVKPGIGKKPSYLDDDEGIHVGTSALFKHTIDAIRNNRNYLETARKWDASGQNTPPVMITVANRTETAARVKYAFDHKKIRIEELCQPDKILHIDSKVLDQAESQEEPVEIESEDSELEDEPVKKLSKKEVAELLRQQVDTIGQVGEPGEKIQKVIAVGMLSEGWDAKTVTHIMGLRAFSSQLLCEQVVGRGLRRTSYETNRQTGFFDAEYVNIFGVPFTFLPHESQDGPPPPPPPPKTQIDPVKEKQQFEIRWPNIIRIDHVYRPLLTLDIEKVKPLELDAYNTSTLAELAPMIEGKPDVTKISQIDLEELAEKFRFQKIIFETAAEVFDQMKPTWKANKEYLLAQVIKIVERFINSDKIQFLPLLFRQDDLRRRILLTLNMQRIVQHIWEAIRFENTESIEPIFDQDYPIRSTGDMRTWYTGKPNEHTRKSHINFCVFDSRWEASEAFELDRNPNVEAWVKNDHLGFEIHYIFDGVVRKYRPDFIIRLKDGTHLILETKGQDTQRDKTKREFLAEWVNAVNDHGGFGKWHWAVSRNPVDVKMIIEKKSEQ